MSNFAILRIAKHKNLGGVLNLARHHTRELPCPTINAARSSLNTGPRFARDAISEISDRIKAAQKGKKKFRSDSVKVLEYMCTASPEWWAKASKMRREEFMARTTAWLEERHPGNVAACWVHYDETSPHLHAFVVPLDSKGVLNAKSFVGSREKLSALQDEFAEVVGHPLGLDRGVKNSGAKHVPVKRYWDAMAAEPPPEPTKMDHAKAALGIANSAIERWRKQGSMVHSARLLHNKARKAATALSRSAKQIATERHDLALEAASLREREARVRERERDADALRERLARAEIAAGADISLEAQEALGL